MKSIHKTLRKAKKSRNGWIAVSIFSGFSGLMRWLGVFGSGGPGTVDIFSLVFFSLSIIMVGINVYIIKEFNSPIPRSE